MYAPYSGSYGIVPLASGDALAKVAGVVPPGLAAYEATNIANWQRNRQHYCCRWASCGAWHTLTYLSQRVLMCVSVYCCTAAHHRAACACDAALKATSIAT